MLIVHDESLRLFLGELTGCLQDETLYYEQPDSNQRPTHGKTNEAVPPDTRTLDIWVYE